MNCDSPIGPLADVVDLENIWRKLDAEETARAEKLLIYASAKLRTQASSVGLDIDAKIAADTDCQYKLTVEMVVCEAVRRAMSVPMDRMPVDTYSQTAGPYSENYKFVNPSGDLWFSKNELKSLGIASSQNLCSIEPATRGDIYGN